MKTRQEALELLNEWVKNPSLIGHCQAVAKCMEAYATKNGLNELEIDKWWICGLLHDFDYEKYPTLEDHPFKGAKVLVEKDFDEDIITAILGHGNHTGVARESLMAKTLFAVDELSGLIIALSKVRPNKFEGMDADSIEKAIKKKDFAQRVSREDIEQGILELGVNRKEHFELLIRALAS